jgi:hypothetical protein
LTSDDTILGGNAYDARKKDIQYTDELDCLFTTVCLNNETDDCSYGADENYREWIFLICIRWTELLSFHLIAGWDSDMCDNPSFSHIQGCRIKKGKPIDVSNLMHRKY